MFVRAALTLAVVLQQIVLPASVAPGASCESAEPAPPPGATCCSMTASTGAGVDGEVAGGVCTCSPSFCGCGHHNPQPTPAQPERTNRTIDHLQPMLATLSVVMAPMPRVTGRVNSFGHTHRAGHSHRIQAVLCIWRT